MYTKFEQIAVYQIYDCFGKRILGIFYQKKKYIVRVNQSNKMNLFNNDLKAMWDQLYFLKQLTGHYQSANIERTYIKTLKFNAKSKYLYTCSCH